MVIVTTVMSLIGRNEGDTLPPYFFIFNPPAS